MLNNAERAGSNANTEARFFSRLYQVHCFTINGRRLALDVHSGALHAPDETAYSILQALQKRLEEKPGATVDILLTDKEEIAVLKQTVCGNSSVLVNETTATVDDPFFESLKEIQTLIEMGQLFSKAVPESEAVVQREPVVKALCLHIAHACNLRCAYCFAGQGAYGHDHSLMSLETGKKAIDFLIARSGKRRHLEVDFFGGEPTLNFDIIKGIVAYGRGREAEASKRFRFTLTTNGTLLDDEMNRFINEHMDNVVLSIDGRPAVNDRMRIYADGTGCYNGILPKLKVLADSRNHEGYYVRGTYTRYNMDFAEDVLHLADEGFSQISVEPAVSSPAEPYALRAEDVPGLCKEYERLAAGLLARERAGKPVRFFHFEIDLDGGPCVAKRITGCGAGTEYLAVTPDGDLYPCHQFVGDEAFKLGSLDNGIVKTDISAQFARCNVFAKAECLECFARYYCGGGCAANAYHANGDITVPDATGCALQRKRVECALFLCAERAVGKK